LRRYKGAFAVDVNNSSANRLAVGLVLEKSLIMNGFKFYEAMSRGKSECNKILYVK